MNIIVPGVTMTDSTVSIGTTTYPIKGITSVSVVKIPASRGPGVFLAFLGLFIAALGVAVPLQRVILFGVGGLFTVVGIVLAVAVKDTWALVLHTAGVETRAYVSRSSDDVIKLKLAITERMK